MMFIIIVIKILFILIFRLFTLDSIITIDIVIHIKDEGKIDFIIKLLSSHLNIIKFKSIENDL